MASPSIPPAYTPSQSLGIMFPGAHHFQISGGTFQVNNNNTPLVFYVKRQLLSAPGSDYYIIGCMVLGTPGETSYIARRFRREEERDRFESFLQKFGWAAFTMKALGKLTVNGDPCLVVSSAAVYTWRDMWGAQSDRWEYRYRLLLKILAFFMESPDVYPGKWDWIQLLNGRGLYENLNLFDGNGMLTMDLEMLKSHGLLYLEHSHFQMHGAPDLYKVGKKWTDRAADKIGKGGMDQVIYGHIQQRHFFLLDDDEEDDEDRRFYEDRYDDYRLVFDDFFELDERLDRYRRLRERLREELERLREERRREELRLLERLLRRERSLTATYDSDRFEEIRSSDKTSTAKPVMKVSASAIPPLPTSSTSKGHGSPTSISLGPTLDFHIGNGVNSKGLKHSGFFLEKARESKLQKNREYLPCSKLTMKQNNMPTKLTLVNGWSTPIPNLNSSAMMSISQAASASALLVNPDVNILERRRNHLMLIPMSTTTDVDVSVSASKMCANVLEENVAVGSVSASTVGAGDDSRSDGVGLLALAGLWARSLGHLLH